MSRKMKRFLFWTPRILCIIFAMFLSLFALDVFGEGFGFWKAIIALLIHLVPVYIVIIVLVLAWRWELIGVIMFNALAVFYIVFTLGKFHWSAFLAISGPLFLIGFLFLFNWIYRAQLRKWKISESILCYWVLHLTLVYKFIEINQNIGEKMNKIFTLKNIWRTRKNWQKNLSIN